MRKLLSYTIAAMLALGFASCSSDEEMPGGENPGAVSFTIEMPKGAYKPAVTYNDMEESIANDAEWNIASIDIYAFLADGTFIKKLEIDDDYRQAETGENKWRVIIEQAFVLDHEFESLHFYFVGNDETSMQGAHIPAAFAGTEADFLNLLTNELEVNAGKAELITINGNDENLLFSGVSRNVYIGGKVAKDVTLKRREARFDILNDNTSVELEEVFIYNANLQGFIFADATATPDIPTAELESIDLTGLENNEYTNMLESVFYLYPTKLGPDGTQIIIKAKVDGADKIFNLESRIAVEANKRYKMILDKSTLTFHVEVVDYEDAEEELPIEQEETGVDITVPGTPVAGVVYNMSSYSGELEFKLNSIHGTRAEVTYHLGAKSDLANPDDFKVELTDRTVTYAYGTEETYEITVPKKLGSSRNFVNIEVKFVSIVDDTKYESVYFRSLTDGVMPAVPGVLAVDESGNLNLDGRGEMLYFKYGSLIGVGRVTGKYDEVFSAPRIAWTPQGFDKDELLYMIGTSTGKDAWVEVPYNQSVEIPAENDEKAGLGDPCKLASKKGYQIGDFRMPTATATTYEAFTDPVWDDRRVGIMTKEGQFYPNAGLVRVLGTTNSALARYMSSSLDSNGRIFMLDFAEARRVPNVYAEANNGAAFMIRCVRASNDDSLADEN